MRRRVVFSVFMFILAFGVVACQVEVDPPVDKEEIKVVEQEQPQKQDHQDQPQKNDQPQKQQQKQEQPEEKGVG